MDSCPKPRVAVVRSLLVLACAPLTFFCGCSGEASATWKPSSRPVESHRSVVSPAPPMPAGGTSGKDIERKVEIEILEKRGSAEGVTQPATGYRNLTLKVRVTNLHERLQIRVRPDRFLLEAQDGSNVLPRQSDRQEPILPTAFLKNGESTDGWLTFQVPIHAGNLRLKSDLTMPPSRIPFILE